MTRGSPKRSRKGERKGKGSVKRTRKGKPAPEEEGDEGNPETRPGTPVSSLIHVQKENSPKILPTRPAGLRRGAIKTRGSPKRSRKGERKGKGSVKRTRKGKPAPEEEGDEGNPETRPGTPVSSLIHVQKENSPKILPTRPAGLRRGAEMTRGSPKRSRKGERKGKGSVKRTRKGKPAPEEEGDEGNPETRPGTPVSSLIHVQKENSPKILPTRPAGLRRGAEKTRGSPKRSRKGERKGKGSVKRTRKGKPAPEEEDPRPSEEEPKRKKGRKRTREEDSKSEAGPEKEGDDGNPETQPGTPVSSLMQVQKENSPKTAPTRPAALRRGAEKEKTRKRKREHHSHRNQLPGLYKNSTTEVKVVEYSHRNQLPGLYKNSTTEVKVVE